MPARPRGWQEGLWSSVGPGAWALKVCPAFPPLQMESSLQVLMRQEDVLLGEAVCPGLLAPGLLPSMWQLYPGRRYRGSDSSFWRIVYHIEFSGTEEMLLEQLPDPEYE
uniref:T cell leukemia/lymphoma 1A n=1 Tax=Lynx canadensis TaxID=61383 RepID=A0A667GCU7_LYNCA